MTSRRRNEPARATGEAVRRHRGRFEKGPVVFPNRVPIHVDDIAHAIGTPRIADELLFAEILQDGIAFPCGPMKAVGREGYVHTGFGSIPPRELETTRFVREGRPFIEYRRTIGHRKKTVVVAKDAEAGCAPMNGIVGFCIGHRATRPDVAVVPHPVSLRIRVPYDGNIGLRGSLLDAQDGIPFIPLRRMYRTLQVFRLRNEVLVDKQVRTGQQIDGFAGRRSTNVEMRYLSARRRFSGMHRCLCRLIAPFESIPTTGFPVPGSVLEEEAEFPRLPFDAQRERVWRTPSARCVIEPADQHAAASGGLGYRETARGGKGIVERLYGDRLEIGRGSQRAQDPAAYLAGRFAGVTGCAVSEILDLRHAAGWRRDIVYPLPTWVR